MTLGMINRHRLARLGVAVALVLGAVISAAASLRPAQAQDNYPSRVIRMIVGFPPGGGNDVVARLLAQKMAEALGQSVVVENRPGSAGSIAAGVVANAAPDGYTILAGANSTIINQIVNPSSSLNVERDLYAVDLIARQPMIVVVNPALKIDTLKGLVQAARTRSINFGTPGVNSIPHLLLQRFLLALPGVNIVHIPFMGANNALLAVIAGQIDAAMVTLPAAAPFIDNKKLVGLAVSSTARSSMLPQIPTTAEAGYPAMTGSIWGAIFVPAKTPKAVIDRLDQVLTKISALPDFKQQLGKLGFDPADETGEQFRHEMSNEIKSWTEVIAKSKLNQH